MGVFQLDWDDFLVLFDKLMPREMIDPLLFFYEDSRQIHVYWPHQSFVFHTIKNKKDIEDLEAFKAQYLQTAFQLTALY